MTKFYMGVNNRVPGLVPPPGLIATRVCLGGVLISGGLGKAHKQTENVDVNQWFIFQNMDV